MAVATHAREAGIDHKYEEGHGERGLGEVGGEHEAPTAGRLKHLVLPGRGESRIQGQYLGVWRVVLAQRLRRLADLALTAHEDQHIARTMLRKLVRRFQDRLLLITVAAFFVAAR